MYAVLAALTGSLTPHRPVFLRLSVSFSLSLSCLSFVCTYMHIFTISFSLTWDGGWVALSTNGVFSVVTMCSVNSRVLLNLKSSALIDRVNKGTV